MNESHPFSHCEYREAILDATGESLPAKGIGRCDGPILTLTITRDSGGTRVVHTARDAHAKRLRDSGFEFIQK